MWRSSSATMLGLAIGIAACGRDAVREMPVRRALDKAQLYGDPTLVPTRAGEAARLELAAAGEIAAAVRATGWLEAAHVDVEDDEPPRVVIAGRRAPSASADAALELRPVIASVLGRDDAEITFAIAEPVSPAPQPVERVPLVLVALGLGASLALVLDRSWRRRSRRRA